MSASKNDADDVLNFLDSLPSDQKNGEGEQQQDSHRSNGGSDPDNSDILDFLDELAQESKATATSMKPAKNITTTKDDSIPKQDNKEITKETSENELENKENNQKQVSTEVNAAYARSALTQQDGTGKPATGNDPLSSISGWWGTSGSKQLNSFWGSASHVVGDLSKTAQSTVLDISKVANDQLKDLNLLDTEDYEKLPELIKARGETLSKNLDAGGSINKVGGLLSSFVNTLNEQIISTAKTINSHDETLKIYIINDELKNFNYIDYLIYNKFQKVISQVEGSIDLEIINSKNFSKLLNILDLASLTNNDNDLKPKSVDFFRGNVLDAEKLSFANIDDGIKTLMQLKKKEKQEKALGPSEVEQKPSTSVSHIFITILPFIQDKNMQTYTSSFEEIVRIDESNTDSFQFLITLKDLEHKFSIVTKSQPFPLQWAKWLTTNQITESTGKKSPEEKEKEKAEIDVSTKASEEVEGIEPADWVKDWIKDGLALSFGVLAQSYVTKRMGF